MTINVAHRRATSIPGPGQTAQYFETVETIEARAEWNAITPLLQQPQRVSHDAKTLVLSGAVSNLKVGDKILMLPGLNPPQDGFLQTVLEVDVQSNGTTWVHLEGWSPDDPPTAQGFSPANYSLNQSASKGQLSDIAANSNLDTATVAVLLNKQWDANTLVALANMQNWSQQQLAAALNKQFQLNQCNAAAVGTAHVLQQQVAAFGHNAPNYYSLQPILRYDSYFESAHRRQKITAAYPRSWEEATLADTSGSMKSIYLDNWYPAILANSWIVLQTYTGTNLTRLIAQVSTNTEVAHSDYTLSGKVSLLALAHAQPLHKYPMRTTSVLCQSSELDLTQVPINDPVSGNQIVLNKIYVGLIAQQTVAVSGERNDLPGVTVAEIGTLKAVTVVSGVTLITLTDSLQYTYKRSTVSINANVALATNGQTVQETLGNGDGSQTFQSFTLRQSPLTYVSADSPSGTATTLQVWVNSLLWQEVPYFFGHGPEEKIYITRQDNSADTTVTFGDGQTGSRLPTGTANIIAKYRRGIGVAGEVSANQLSMMTSRPLGVRGVTNPLAADGAADPEDLDNARQNATLTILALDRIVSLSTTTRTSHRLSRVSPKPWPPGVGAGQQRVVLLTVAGNARAPPSPKGPNSRRIF